MGRENKLGLGPRHRTDLLTKSEARERELREGQRTIEHLQSRCRALEQTLATIVRLGSHYVPTDASRDEKNIFSNVGRGFWPKSKPSGERWHPAF